LDGGGRSKVLIAGLLMGIFLAAVDSTVVSVAMPTIASSLRGVEIYSWAFTAYILTSTVSGPLWGRISDVYGRKTIYLMGVCRSFSLEAYSAALLRTCFSLSFSGPSRD
jgi:MFS family permease